MFGLFCFVLAVLASPFKSKSRLEAENAVLRHQLIVLRRNVHGRVRLTNNDRWFLIQLYRWFPSILNVLTINHLASGINAVDLKHRLGDIETDCRNRLHDWLLQIVGALTAPTFMALTCRWRSRPQHQKRTHAPQQTTSLFDHLIGGSEQGWRHSNAECLRGLEIDNQLILGRRPDQRSSSRHFCRVLAQVGWRRPVSGDLCP